MAVEEINAAGGANGKKIELIIVAHANKQQRQKTMQHIFELFPRMREKRKQSETLSGGEQQMLAIGRGLMSLPKLMMFDEPSLGLAPILVHEIFEMIKRINREEGVTILLVEQNVRQTLAMCRHRAYALRKRSNRPGGLGEGAVGG